MSTFIRSVDGKVVIEIEPGSPATLMPNISDQGLQAQIDSLRTEIRTYRGQPVVVNDAADMDDELTIYLYMGSEEGYNANHWYYYDGTEWVDGGEYVANPVLIDDTLTQSGEAADAKVTGDEISAIKADLTQNTINVGIHPDITDNSWINQSGVIENINGYSRTDYIDLSNCLSFTVDSMTLGNYIYYCFYDDNYAPVGTRQRCYNDTSVQITTGSKYLIITSSTANMTDGNIVVNKKTRLSALEEKVNSVSRVNDITTVHPDNLLIDRMVKASDGSISVSDVFVCTDYISIPFEENQPIDVIGTFVGVGGCAIYNSKKQRILGIDGNNVSTYGGTSGLTIQRITVPYQSGMKYIRISGVKTLVNNDPTKLGIVGCTFNGVYSQLFSINESVNANIPNVISHSKVLVIGDSISADAYGEYPKWVTDLIQCGFLPADTNNSSQHATGFVATANGLYDSFLTRLEAITNTSTYDIVIVFGGINDYLQNIPLGSDSGTDYTVSFKPAVNEFFRYLIENFTQARLCVLLPLRTYHTGMNTEGEYQKAYSDYIKDVAKSYCLPILNLTEESGFMPFVDSFKNMWTLMPSGQTAHDGVHPTEEYELKYLMPMIRHFLQGMM